MKRPYRTPVAFRAIGEVGAELGLPLHTLHFWERKFPQIKPVRRSGCRRYYRPEDVELLRGIRRLLYEKGYTVRGVQQILAQGGLNDDGVARMTETGNENDGWEWAIVEIFGHRSHAGRAREEERFGSKMLRIDVPIEGDPVANGWETHWYGGSSIFSYTLTDEDSVLRSNKPYDPPARFRLLAPHPGDSDDFVGENETRG